MTTESSQEALERRISELQAVNEIEDSWRAIVKGGDPDNCCTKAEIFEVRQRAAFHVRGIPTCTQTHEPMDMA